MWHAVTTFFTNPGIKHTLDHAMDGFLVAAAIDFQAYKNMKSWHDVLTYKWGMASFRWVQGAIIGIVAANTLESIWG